MKPLSVPLVFTLAVLQAPSLFAGDCWVSTSENAGTGFGDQISQKRYASMRGVLERVEVIQKSDAVANAFPRVRYQIHRYIGTPQHAGAPMVGQSIIFLHKPESWLGRCGLQPWADDTHFAELDVSLNSLRALGGDAPFFYAPKLLAIRDGMPLYQLEDGNRLLVITAGGLPALVPVTVGEYLEHWQRQLSMDVAESNRDMQALAEDVEMKEYIRRLRKTDPRAAAELQAELDQAAQLAGRVGADELSELKRTIAGLSNEERLRPVYLSSAATDRVRFGYAQASDAGAAPLVKLNPALWSGRRSESEVRTVALELLIQDGDSSRAVGADRWLEQVDLRPYRELLKGEGS